MTSEENLPTLQTWAERHDHVQALKAAALAFDGEIQAARQATNHTAQAVRDANAAARAADQAAHDACKRAEQAQAAAKRAKERVCEASDVALGHSLEFHAQGIFAGARFENFEPQTPMQAAALQAVQAFPCTDPKARTQTALLCGPVGTGKTHLAAAWVASFDPANCNAEFARARDIADSFKGLRDAEFVAQFKRWDGSQVGCGGPDHGCEYLAIDDLGAGMTKAEIEIVRDVIVRRIDAGMVTLITTNMDANDRFAALGGRVCDRLKLGGVLVPFDGESFRSKPLQDRDAPDTHSPRIAALEAHAEELEQEARALEEAEQAASEAARALRGVADQASQAHKASLAQVDAATQARKSAATEFRIAQSALRYDTSWLLARRNGLTHQELAKRVIWISRIEAQKQEVQWHLQGWRVATVNELPSYAIEDFAEELDQIEPPLLTGEVPDGARALLCEELPPTPKFEAPSAAPAATASASPSDGAMTLEVIKELTTRAAAANRDAVVHALEKYGAKRAPDLKPERWDNYAAELREIIDSAARKG